MKNQDKGPLEIKLNYRNRFKLKLKADRQDDELVRGVIKTLGENQVTLVRALIILEDAKKIIPCISTVLKEESAELHGEKKTSSNNGMGINISDDNRTVLKMNSIKTEELVLRNVVRTLTEKRLTVDRAERVIEDVKKILPLMAKLG